MFLNSLALEYVLPASLETYFYSLQICVAVNDGITSDSAEI